MSNKIRSINNPAGGDCAFYALALGMMDVIQKQSAQNTHSELFESWLRSDTELTGVSLQTIQEFNITKKVHSQADNDLLLKLQFSLRRIAAKAVKTDLLTKINEERNRPTERLSLIEGSSVAISFMALVQNELKKQPLDTKFNDLALNPEVRNLAKQTAQEVNRQLKGIQNFPERHRIETAIIKQVILDDVIVNGKPNDNSVLLNGVDTVKQQGKWGTHDNLKVIAGYLGINLRVNNQIDGVNDPDLPTITLNNLGNCHWTTQIQVKQNELVEDSIAAPEKKTYASNVAEQLAKHTPLSNTTAPKPTETETVEDNAENLIEATKAQRFDMQQRFQSIAKKNIADYTDEELAITLQEEEFLKAGM